MATFTVDLPEYGTTAYVACEELLHTVAYPERHFGKSSADAVRISLTLQALAREVLQLRERMKALEGK